MNTADYVMLWTGLLSMLWASPFVLFSLYAVPLALRGGIRRTRPIAMLCCVGLAAHIAWGFAWLVFPDKKAGWAATVIFSPWVVPSLAYAILLLRVTGARSGFIAAVSAGALCFAYEIGIDAYLASTNTGRFNGDIWSYFLGPPHLALWHGPVGVWMWRWSRAVSGAGMSHPMCSRCGYALTGLANPLACPECGASFDRGSGA